MESGFCLRGLKPPEDSEESILWAVLPVVFIGPAGGGTRGQVGGRLLRWMELRFLSSWQDLISGRGWSEPVSTRHLSLPGSVPLPGSPSGQGQGPQRRDRTRSEHPLPRGRESAVCFEF